tara:strand:- start:1249 stop:2241 length:993 start_codon:yes stop_codon:yes gene_type:complete
MTKLKRGRKSTAKIFNDEGIKKKTLNLLDDECIIACIPLSLTDINVYNKKKGFEIISNKKEGKIKKDFNKNNEKSLDIKKQNIKKDFNKNNQKSLDIKKEKINFNKIQEINQISKIETQYKNKIISLENKIIKLKKNIDDYNITSKILYNSASLLNNEIKQNNSCVCWWCCHKFNSLPLYLPTNIVNDKFNVMGYFCTFNCAMAFNIDLNDNNIWTRSTYLNKFYYSIFKKYTNIKAAPSKYILDIFGGDITIKQFRKKLIKLNYEYRFILPPFISIIPTIEEKKNENINFNNQENVIFNKIKNNYKLQRTKNNNNNNNTIDKIMKLTKL